MNDVSQEREIKRQLGQGNNFTHPALKDVLRDKMKCTIDCVNYFLRYLLVYRPFCLVTCCQGKLGNSQIIASVSHTLFSKELGKVNIHYTHRQLDLIMYNATVLSTMWWL